MHSLQFDWNVQPILGLIKGNYYREENNFAPHFEGDIGYHGILEVIVHQNKIVMVEFNEINHPDYYERKFSGQSKRLSGYGFFQEKDERAKKTGIVLVNGLTHLENQMVKGNRLSGSFDLLTGASNSINRSMLILAERVEHKINANLSDGYYYGFAKNYGNGITARLQLVKAKGVIVSASYDEILANHPDDISDERLKPFYRQSKYHSVDYGDSFKKLSDELSASIIARQSLHIKPQGFFQVESQRIEELLQLLEEEE